jgi:hypothetical protein
VNLTPLASWAEAWLRDHLERILPVQGQGEQRKTAWETFIRYSVSDSRSFALLHEQYSIAIDGMPRDMVAEPFPHDPRVSLGQHLVMCCRRGLFDFDQPGNLLAAFFARAPEAVRAEVMAYVGRSLAQSNEPISPEQSARLLKLWNWLVRHESPSGGPGFQHKVA